MEQLPGISQAADAALAVAARGAVAGRDASAQGQHGGAASAPLRPPSTPPPPDAEAGPWTREPYDDVDPMPDYENVLTD